MLKKMLSIMLSAFLAMSIFAGCGSSSDSSSNNGNQSRTEQTSDENAKPIKDISAKELVAQMKVGWNLGNTMESTGADGLDAETSWGNPKTREDMIKLVKDSGFNVLRIPVTWDKHMDKDYNVDKDWMARVKEIVDYGIDNDMYVILNTHHEEWYFPNSENKDEDIKQITALWSQIAEEFKGYDEHLLFEGFNEPRLRDTSSEWTDGTPEAQNIINDYEKAFYDAVRNSGGNNQKRHLLITGYAASSMTGSMEAIKLPSDTDDKLIVSIHAYLPYTFALDKNGTDKFSDKSDTVSIDSLFSNIDRIFLSKNIPVIIGEFGAMNKFNDDDRIEWVKYYLKTAKQSGVPCLWWDNGAFFGNGENFGLLNREIPASWKFKEIVDAIMDTVNNE